MGIKGRDRGAGLGVDRQIGCGRMITIKVLKMLGRAGSGVVLKLCGHNKEIINRCQVSGIWQVQTMAMSMVGNNTFEVEILPGLREAYLKISFVDEAG